MYHFGDLARGAASLGTALVDASSFWLLVALTVSIALPWLRLRKVPVEIETPSSHVALARFGVVYVATGSGIGPCLPHLLTGDVPARLVWSTRSPRKTYSDQLVDEILQVQPDAIIWDTDADGKPDMVKLAN